MFMFQDGCAGAAVEERAKATSGRGGQLEAHLQDAGVVALRAVLMGHDRVVIVRDRGKISAKHPWLTVKLDGQAGFAWRLQGDIVRTEVAGVAGCVAMDQFSSFNSIDEDSTVKQQLVVQA